MVQCNEGKYMTSIQIDGILWAVAIGLLSANTIILMLIWIEIQGRK